MNIIEFLGVEPFVFGVANFEVAVWRDAYAFRGHALKIRVLDSLYWLDGAEITTDDFGRGVFCSCAELM